MRGGGRVEEPVQEKGDRVREDVGTLEGRRDVQVTVWCVKRFSARERKAHHAGGEGRAPDFGHPVLWRALQDPHDARDPLCPLLTLVAVLKLQPEVIHRKEERARFAPPRLEKREEARERRGEVVGEVLVALRVASEKVVERTSVQGGLQAFRFDEVGKRR